MVEINYTLRQKCPVLVIFRKCHKGVQNVTPYGCNTTKYQQLWTNLIYLGSHPQKNKTNKQTNLYVKKTIDSFQRSLLQGKAKKKYFVSKLARIFQTDAACGFLFCILLFFYFNWPLPPRTSETKNDWKVSTSVFSEIKLDFTRFLSSHVLKSSKTANFLRFS